jgi:hypothetical protein
MKFIFIALGVSLAACSYTSAKPEDFPVNAEGKKINKQDGTPIAETADPQVAEDIADRLNEGDARREQDKWSA